MKKPKPTQVGKAGKITAVPASEVKNAWHEFVDRVSRAREEIIVTRDGGGGCLSLPLAPSRGTPTRSP